EDVENGSFEDSIFDLSPELQLNEDQFQYLKGELQSAAPALEKARELIHLPRGRYEVDWSRGEVPADLPCQHCRRVAKLLCFESILKAQNRKGDEALANAQAALNAGRSVGD